MAVPTYKAVLKKYDQAPEEVRWYFSDLPKLVKEFPWEVSIAYLLMRVETAQNMVLYCGVVKLHRANATVARQVIDRQHIRRKRFLGLFENVYGRKLGDPIVRKLKSAEKVRDRVVHGKKVKPAVMRDAVVDVLDYARRLNAFVEGIAGLEPFGHLRGFKGRGTSLDGSTTRWLLKGMGFNVG